MYPSCPRNMDIDDDNAFYRAVLFAYLERVIASRRAAKLLST